MTISFSVFPQAFGICGPQEPVNSSPQAVPEPLANRNSRLPVKTLGNTLGWPQRRETASEDG